MEQTPSWITLVNPGLCIVTVLLVYLGYRKGFLSKLLSCLSFIVIVFISWQIAPVLGKVFNFLPVEWAPYQDTLLAEFFYGYANQLLIFAILVVLASLVIFLLKPIILLFEQLPVISTLNRVLGACFGLVETLLWSFMLLFVLHTPLVENGQAVIEQTYLRYVNDVQETVFAFASDALKEFDFGQISAEKDLEAMKSFLSEQGFSDSDIQQFLKELGK